MTHFKISYQAQGLIKSKANNDVPILLRIEQDRYDVENIFCELILLRGAANSWSSFRKQLSGDEYGNLVINIDDCLNSQVVLNGINGWSLKDNRARLNINSYEYGLNNEHIDGIDNIYVNVELSPTGILSKGVSKEFHTDGRIQPLEVYTDDVDWEFTLGKGQASVKYEYEEDKIYDNKTTLQIERPSLFFNINPKNNLSIQQIKKEIEKETTDVCLILSLCYRKSVSWYEMKFTIIQNQPRKINQSPVVRKKIYPKSYSDHDDELINHRDLINGGLYTLVNSLRQSPYTDALRRTIIFIASSHSNNTVEVNYFLCLIALEALCDNFWDHSSSKVKIPSSKWKKLEKQLKLLLDSFALEEGLQDIIEKIKKKLPELKQVTTVDKIISCCQSLNTKTDDLWIKDGFESGLRNAIDMRNKLFHSAYCDEPFMLYANLIKLRVLTERIILKILNWPDDKIWRWYDQELKRLKI